MLCRLLAFVGAALVVSSPPPPPIPGLPTGVPPLVAMAVAKQGGADTWQIDLTVPKVRWEVVGKVVPKSEWPRLECGVEKVTRTVSFGGPSALTEARVLDVKGKPVPADDVQKRLASETPVLVSVDLAMPDPYYLQVTKPDTLIVVLGPREHAPSPELLPAPKGTPDPKPKGEPGAAEPRK